VSADRTRAGPPPQRGPHVAPGPLTGERGRRKSIETVRPPLVKSGGRVAAAPQRSANGSGAAPAGAAGAPDATARSSRRPRR
jgi:hypothetical protein